MSFPSRRKPEIDNNVVLTSIGESSLCRHVGIINGSKIGNVHASNTITVLRSAIKDSFCANVATGYKPRAA